MEHAAVDACYIIEAGDEPYCQPEATVALDAAHRALTIASNFVT